MATAHKLKELDFEVKDEMVAAIMLSGLPDDYKPMLMGLESSGTRITSDAVKVKLLQEVNLATESSGTGQAAFFSKSSTKQAKNTNQSKKCFVCNKSGHFAAKCKYRHREKEVDKQRNQHSALVITETKPNKNVWYLDSCASSHMTQNAEWLQDVQKTCVPVVTANNEQLSARSRGTVEVNVKLGDKEKLVYIEEVLHVPKLAANLLSVSKIVEKGHKVIFDKSGCKIRDLRGRIKARANLHQGVYRLESAEETACSIKEEGNANDLWHKRLGHLNRKGMDLLRKGLATGMKNCVINTEKCNTCVEGKSSRLPFKKQGRRSNSLLQLIHSDVCGPMSTYSIGGAKYMLTFIDDFSRKKFVYFLKGKHEVTDAFIKFKALVENQSEQKIKVIRTDNGKEYVNNRLKQILEKFGIVHQTTEPYTPEHNGVAERTNRTIVDMARTMLLEAKLPRKYWAEAVSTAVYLLNRCPTRALSNTVPEEIWTKTKPDLSHLRIFGCEAMVHIPKEKRDKWDPKAKELLFMGYSENGKGYRLIDSKTNKITISRNVTFFENNFLTESQLKVEQKKIGNFPIIQETEHDDEESINDNSKQTHAKTEEEQSTSEDDNEFEEAEEDVEIEQTASRDDIQPSNALRRSERIRKPVIREGYISYYTVENSTGEPETPEEALGGPEKTHWLQAMKTEYEALKRNHTWDFVSKPKDKNILTTRWVFKKKQEQFGNQRFKARLVVKGCAQRQGIDYEDTFSPVVKYDSIRYLLSLAAKENLEITHMDVTSAYLNGDLEEEIYVKPPDEFKAYDKSEGVWRLKKALYGLKQSGRAWNKTLDNVLKQFKLQNSEADPCIYYRKIGGKKLIVAIYVDDLLILSDDKTEERKLKKHLRQNFQMKDLGEVKNFLGMNIRRDREHGNIQIDQTEYIKSILKRFRMDDSNPISTPADPNAKLTMKNQEQNLKENEQVSRDLYESSRKSVVHKPDFSSGYCFCCKPSKSFL